MDVILRVKPSEIKVDDLYFPKGLSKLPHRIAHVVRSKSSVEWPEYDTTTFLLDNDDTATLYERRRYVVAREVVFVDGSFR